MRRICTRTGMVSIYFSVIATLLIQASAGAATYAFDFDAVFDGAAPAGASSQVTAVFQDAGPGAVDLTISAPGLTPGEYVGAMFFNLNPVLNPTQLNFTRTASIGSFSAPSIAKGMNRFSPDNQDRFDLELGFSTTNGKQFGPGDSIEYVITGILGFDAADFVFRDSLCSGTGLYYAAADIGGVQKCNQTGLVAVTSSNELATVPEPSTTLFFSLAVGLFAGLRRFRRRVS
jgi:hypothetical protein